MSRLAASVYSIKNFEMTSELHFTGIYKLNGELNPFNGTLTFKENEKDYYCTWSLYCENGNSIAGKSFPIYFQQIPNGYDRLKFAQKFAIEGIKKYRIGRERIVVKLNM